MSIRGTRLVSITRRPITQRRSAMVVGEVRTYQELIRLVVERNRLLAERKMWSNRYEDVSRQLAGADRYYRDLQQRLGLTQMAASGGLPGQPKAVSREQPSGGGARRPMEFRYCPDK